MLFLLLFVLVSFVRRLLSRTWHALRRCDAGRGIWCRDKTHCR